jgi:putative transposase
MKTQNMDYCGYRFPPEIISYAVWLYHRFSLSFRDIEEVLAERGVTVSHEAIRLWCLLFGQAFAKRLRGRPGRLGDTWHLDEMFVTRHGARHYLWRAVDQDGEVLDILVQNRRDKHAAKRFFRTLLKGLQYVPQKLVTDKLASYGAARREILSRVPQCQGGRQNNRAEVAPQPTQQRERHMRRSESSRQAQRFLSVHRPSNNLFRCRRHLTSAPHYRTFRTGALATWREVTCVQNAA